MKRHIFNTEQELIFAFAQFFVDEAQSYIKAQGVCNVVLAGGSSPKRVYELLASTEFRGQVDWSKVNFFFGDERHVPAEDSRNNALMVEKALFQPLQISANQVFKVDTSVPPKDSAKKYMDTISEYFKGQTIRFDLILLGLGDDSHTASLFPHTDVLADKTPSVKAVYLKDEDSYRISMTAPLINQAKGIAFLVYGAKKAEAVKHVIDDPADPEEFPAQLIKPQNGVLHWFLDAIAAGLLVD